MTCVSMAELERSRLIRLVVCFSVSLCSESKTRLSETVFSESNGARLSVGSAKVSLKNGGIESD